MISSSKPDYFFLIFSLYYAQQNEQKRSQDTTPSNKMQPNESHWVDSCKVTNLLFVKYISENCQNGLYCMNSTTFSVKTGFNKLLIKNYFFLQKECLVKIIFKEKNIDLKKKLWTSLKCHDLEYLHLGIWYISPKCLWSNKHLVEYFLL